MDKTEYDNDENGNDNDKDEEKQDDLSLKLSSHTNSIIDIITVDNEHLLTLSVDNTAKYWSLTQNNFGKLVQTISSTAPTKMYSLSDKRILIPNFDSSLTIYDKKLRPVKPLMLFGHESWVMNYCELRNKHLATCSRDKTIRIWDMSDGQCLIILEGHSDIVNSIAETNDQFLISSSSDCTIKIWMLFDDDQYECLGSIVDGMSPVLQVEVIDKEMLITRSESTVMNLYKFRIGEIIHSYSNHTTNVVCMVILYDKRIASGSYDRSIKIWNCKEKNEEGTLIGHNHTVFCIRQITSDKLISGSGDSTIKYWDIVKYKCLATFVGHTNFVVSLSVINDNAFASGSYDNSLRVWVISN